MNADGFDDVVTGVSFANVESTDTRAGFAYILFGPFVGEEGLADADGIWKDEAEGDAGRVVAADDVTGDGVSDVIVGAWRSSAYQIQGGAFMSWKDPPHASMTWATLAPAFTPMWMFFSEAVVPSAEAGDKERFGFATSGTDVDGDGFSDLLVGAPWVERFGAYAGAVYVFYGPVSGSLDTKDAGAWWYGDDVWFSGWVDVVAGVGL